MLNYEFIVTVDEDATEGTPTTISHRHLLTHPHSHPLIVILICNSFLTKQPFERLKSILIRKWFCGSRETLFKVD